MGTWHRIGLGIVLAALALPGTARAQRGARDPGVLFVVSQDGTRIAVEQTGTGPALVLVGGALSLRGDTAHLAALLAPHFRVFRYDRRGRGDSGNTLPWAVEREVEDLAAVIDAAGGTAFLYGGSSGAVLALETATRLPARVEKLVLFEPPFIVDDSRPPIAETFPDEIAALVADGRRGDAVAAFLRIGVGLPPEVVAGLRTSAQWPVLEELAHTIPYDLRILGDTQRGNPLPTDRWGSMHAPTLVLDGGLSPIWLRNAAQALVTVLYDAEGFTLDGQDHVVATFAPQVLAPVLIDFLGG